MSLQTAWMAGMETWRQGIDDAPLDQLQSRYVERWLLHRGDLFLDGWRTNPYRNDPRVYKNMSLLWNHTTRVVNFWASIVYQGALSDEPGEGAIPILPDKTLNEEQVKALMTAIDVLNGRWNWQHQMLLIPKLTSALGDLGVELIEDRDKRFVFPRFLWPGYVTEIDLDYIGNVVSYTLEYTVREEQPNGKLDTYTYRKEVDVNEYRYFRNGDPHDYGSGRVVPNPYGFVPMVWFRHMIDGINDRGMAAIDPTRQLLLQANSLFSHARDFQHKAFYAPILVKGQMAAAGATTINLFPAEHVAREDASALAQRLKFLTATGDVDIKQPVFDLGQTLAMLKDMRDGILATHPEATFFDKLADAQNVTGPGADRIILPIKGQVTEGRAGYDIGMVHLYQQAMSMAGYHVAEGDWGERTLPDGSIERIDLDVKRKAFVPFGPGAWERGDMAFTIKDREIVPLSRAEKVAIARDTEMLQSQWALEFAGVSADDVTTLLQERNDRFEAAMSRGEFGGVYGGTDGATSADNEDTTNGE